MKKKNCFISGATGGLGKSIAKQFAKNNYNLFLTSTKSSSLKKFKKELMSINKNIDVFYEAGDLTRISDLESIAKSAIKKFGLFHILINNAGVFPVKYIEKTSLNDYQNCFDKIGRAHV